MSDFFSKLKKGIDKSAKVISTKSTSAIESNKIKSELNALKKSKNETFSAIGQKVYEAVLAEGFDPALVEEEVSALKDFDLAIVEKEAEIERIKAETEAKLDEINTVVEDEIVEPIEEVEVEIEVTEAVEEAVEEVKEVELQETEDEI